jgi:hypothetical protein
MKMTAKIMVLEEWQQWVEMRAAVLWFLVNYKAQNL